MPKLSVVVPVYGVEKYIARCAESLFAQTLDDVEFIFVDDCTPDRSIDVLQGVVERHRSRIAEMRWTVRVERMAENSGQAAVRRHGVQSATGDYVIHCDSDDWVEPDAYRLMYDCAVSEGCDIVFCDYYKSTDIGRTRCSRLGGAPLDREALVRAMLCDRLPSYSIWSVLCRRSLYDGIVHPTGSMSEDWCAVLQMLYLSCGRLGYVRQPLYNYYLNQESISFNPRRIADRSMVDKRIRNTRQMVENTDIVFQFLSAHGGEAYEPLFVNTKLWAKRLLCRMSADGEVYRLWRSIYPEVEGHVLLNRNVTRKNRLMYLAMRLRIYPLLAAIIFKGL